MYETCEFIFRMPLNTTNVESIKDAPSDWDRYDYSGEYYTTSFVNTQTHAGFGINRYPYSTTANLKQSFYQFGGYDFFLKGYSLDNGDGTMEATLIGYRDPSVNPPEPATSTLLDYHQKNGNIQLRSMAYDKFEIDAPSLMEFFNPPCPCCPGEGIATCRMSQLPSELISANTPAG